MGIWNDSSPDERRRAAELVRDAMWPREREAPDPSEPPKLRPDYKSTAGDEEVVIRETHSGWIEYHYDPNAEPAGLVKGYEGRTAGNHDVAMYHFPDGRVARKEFY
jgi:hypothetical protein